MRAVNWPPPLAIAAPRIGQARPLDPNGRLSAIDKYAVHGPLWLDALGLRMRRGDFVLRNVPPATVYVYERANPAG